MSRSPGALILAACASVFAGCPPADGPDGGDSGDPALARWPAAELPFAVRLETRSGLEDGIVVNREVVNNPPDDFGAKYRDLKGMLAAVGALPNHVAVVFPPADRVGFDVAWAGLDSPWARAPLNDLPVDQVGDVAVTQQGNVLYALFRGKGTPQALTLHTWSPGGSPTTEAVPRPAPSQGLGYRDRCSDLSLGVASDGRVEVVTQQVDADGRTRLLHATRTPAGAWSWETIADSATDFTEPITDSRDMHDVACRNVLALDESEQPIVVTLHRIVKKQSAQLASVIGEPLPKNRLRTYWRGGDGVWRRAQDGPLSAADRSQRTPAPFFRMPDTPGGSYLPQFDLQVHPSGFLVGSLAQTFGHDDLAHPVGSVRRTSFPFRSPVHEERDYTDWGVLQSGGAMEVDDCGTIRSYYTLWRTTDWGGGWAVGNGQAVCRLDRRAPVVGGFDNAFRFATVARGRALPYPAGICLTPANALTVCIGGHRPSDGKRDHAVVELVSANVEPGSTIAADTVLDLRLSRAREADEALVVQLVPVGAMALEWGTYTVEEGPEPGRLRIRHDPFAPGVRYHLEVQYGEYETQYARSWQYAGKKAPVLDFEVAPSGLGPDPRTTLLRFPCEMDPNWQRAADGICEYKLPVDPRPEEAIWLNLPADPLTASAEPKLVDDTGRVWPSRIARISVDPKSEYERLHWTSMIPEFTTFEVVFPPDTVSRVGGPMHADDLRHRFRTRAQPPYVKQSVPAHMATNVDPAAPVELEFNTTVTIHEGGLRLEKVPVFQALPVSALQLTATRWRFLHDPLDRNAEYRIVLSDRIQDGFAQSLQQAPVVIGFWTAP